MTENFKIIFNSRKFIVVSVHCTEKYGELEVDICSSITTETGEGERFASRPCCFDSTTRLRTTIELEAGWIPEPVRNLSRREK